MEKGPYIKSHPVIQAIRDFNPAGCKGFTYEIFDKYTTIWFNHLAEAELFRRDFNAKIGWSIVTKPEMISSDDDANPYIIDVACVCLVPKDIADRNEKYDGDAMKGALMELVESGIEVRL